MARVTRFRQLVQQRHWTVYETFSMYFQRAAKELAEHEGDPQLATVAVSRRSFDRWMAGDLKRMPWPSTCRILERLLGEPAPQMFALPEGTSAEVLDIGDTPIRESSEIAPFNEPSTATQSVLRPQRPTANATHEVQHPEFDDPLEVVAQTQSLTSSNAALALLDVAVVSTRSIVERYEALGPRLLVGETRQLRRMLHSVLVGQQPPRVRTELFALAGRTAGLLGYMSVNAGASFPVTDAYCREAEALARESGDRAVEMWAAGTRSLGLYYAGRYTEADQAAQAGIALASEDPQAIRLLVNGRARALARLGDRRGTERAIGQAMALSDRSASLPDGLTPCIGFAPYSAARSLANAITARLSLGDASDVLAYADEIDDMVERSDSEWSRALVRLDVASALLRQSRPDIEHAMSLGRSALRSGTSAPIRSVWQRATELYDHASRWHEEPEVREYAEELRMWRSEPQASPILAGWHGRTAL